MNTLNDLERRKQNLIITGIPESDDDEEEDTEQAETCSPSTPQY